MTPTVPDYENWFEDRFDRRRLDDTYLSPTVQPDYENLSEKYFVNGRCHETLNCQLKDGYLTPTAHPLHIQDSTPTGSIISHSYCEIVTPITDDGYLKPFNIQDSTPTGSISSHSYCEIDSPIRDHRLIFTIASSPKLPIQPIRGRHGNKRGKITRIASSVERKPKTGLFSRAKKKSAKTSLTQTSQIEKQRSDTKKSSQVIPSFTRGKFQSSLSKITQKNQSTENHETSPCIAPIKTRQNLRNESLFQSSDKSSQSNGFLSKCRNRLQNLTMKAN